MMMGLMDEVDERRMMKPSKPVATDRFLRSVPVSRRTQVLTLS